MICGHFWYFYIGPFFVFFLLVVGDNRWSLIQLCVLGVLGLCNFNHGATKCMFVSGTWLIFKKYGLLSPTIGDKHFSFTHKCHLSIQPSIFAIIYKKNPPVLYHLYYLNNRIFISTYILQKNALITLYNEQIYHQLIWKTLTFIGARFFSHMSILGYHSFFFL